MGMKKALVYDRKTGNRYYAEDIIIDEGFVKLINPVRHNRIGRDIQKFEKVGKTFRSRSNYLFEDYGIKCFDTMLPSYAVTVELTGDESPQWTRQTEQEATATIDRLQKECKTIHDKEKLEFLSKMGLWERILYHMGE